MANNEESEKYFLSLLSRQELSDLYVCTVLAEKHLTPKIKERIKILARQIWVKIYVKNNQ